VRVLAVNAGSSSLKVRLLGDGDVLEESADLPAGHDGFDQDELSRILRAWPKPDAVGHRVVHGGTRFSGPVRVEGPVRQQLEDLIDLAPLHQPKSLAALDAVTAALPHIPSVASFDTAFHATIPPAASTYAVPLEWRQRYSIRRYGFHGLSHRYAAGRAAELCDRPIGELRIVTCHLGAGASLCAVENSRSSDTTMGFTPLEGLVMATRSGNVDPGLVLWLEEHEHLSPHDVATALEQQSGLTALAGTGDMRQIETRADAGDGRARLALDVYVHALVAGIASMTAAMAGLDVLVFTGGVGEHSEVVRRLATERLAFLGVGIDAQSNADGRVDRDLSAPGAPVCTVVVEAREDLQIAAETRLVSRPSSVL